LVCPKSKRPAHLRVDLRGYSNIVAIGQAEAPIAADIAANSDSTFTYSNGASSPVFTIADNASTMCVCGEMG
jgi:hypothetical protein